MVKKLLKFFAFSLFFIIALVAFSPKESFYFLLEKEFQKFDVIVSNETLQEHLLSLEVQNLEITTKGIESAQVESTDIKLLLFYNTIHLKNIMISSLVSAYIPSKVQSIDVTYSIFNPLLITLKGEGDFGQAQAEFHLLDRELKLLVNPSKVMLSRYRKTMQMLTKDESGEYLYAKTF